MFVRIIQIKNFKNSNKQKNLYYVLILLENSRVKMLVLYITFWVGSDMKPEMTDDATLSINFTILSEFKKTRSKCRNAI